MTVPNKLFKYASASTARIVLDSGRLRWSSPNIFNDLAEFQRLPTFDPPLKKSIADLQELIVAAAVGTRDLEIERLAAPTRLAYELIKQGIANGIDPKVFLDNPEEDRPLDQIYHQALRVHFGENFTKHARVLSLTENPVNAVMWAHYGDTHTGLVLGFRHLPDQDTPLQVAKRVSYFRDAPSIGSGLDFLLYGDSEETRKLTIDHICFSKRVEWQYEEEWRAITWRPDEGDALFGDYPFLPGELESVTFGSKVSASTVGDVTQLVRGKYPACSLYQVHSEHGDLLRVSLADHADELSR